LLTRGGGAELYDVETEELEWSSDDDEEFAEEFEDFLAHEDVADILDYLVEIECLTDLEADHCEILEEYYTQADLSGEFR
jgi:hypothetical protein